MAGVLSEKCEYEWYMVTAAVAWEFVPARGSDKVWELMAPAAPCGRHFQDHVCLMLGIVSFILTFVWGSSSKWAYL